jgi:hypothetical protein
VKRHRGCSISGSFGAVEIATTFIVFLLSTPRGDEVRPYRVRVLATEAASVHPPFDHMSDPSDVGSLEADRHVSGHQKVLPFQHCVSRTMPEVPLILYANIAR